MIGLTDSLKVMADKLNAAEFLMPLGDGDTLALESVAVFVVASSPQLPIYTVPAGFDAVIQNCLSWNNTASTFTTAYFSCQMAGQPLPLTVTQTQSTISPAAYNIHGFSCNVFKSGETLYFENVAAGLVVLARVTLIPVTSSRKALRLAGVNNGDNVIYTCPAGKRAVLSGQFFVATGSAPLTFVNRGITAITGQAYVTISSVRYELSASTSLPVANNGTGSQLTTVSSHCLNAGDTVGFTANNSTNIVGWGGLFEVDV